MSNDLLILFSESCEAYILSVFSLYAFNNFYVKNKIQTISPSPNPILPFPRPILPPGHRVHYIAVFSPRTPLFLVACFPPGLGGCLSVLPFIPAGSGQSEIGLNPRFSAGADGVYPSASSGFVDMVFADSPYFLSSGGVTCKGEKFVPVNKADWEEIDYFDLNVSPKNP